MNNETAQKKKKKKKKKKKTLNLLKVFTLIKLFPINEKGEFFRS